MENKKIITSKINLISNQKGNIIKLIDKYSDTYVKFGELYLTKIKPNKIKAWKMHLLMTSNLFILVGKVKFVIVKKINKEIKYISYELSANKINHISIPKKTIFGFKGLSDKDSIIINLASIPHSKNESVSYKLREFNYNWK